MGGRPVGSTNEVEKYLERWKVATTNLITQQVKEARDAGTLSTYFYKKVCDRALGFHSLLDSGFFVNSFQAIWSVGKDPETKI